MLTAEEFLECVPKELTIEEQLRNMKITPEMIEQARKNGGQLPMIPGQLDNPSGKFITPEMIKQIESKNKKKKKSIKEQVLEKRRSKIANKSKRQNRKK